MLTKEDKLLPPDGLAFRLLVLAEEMDETGRYVKANMLREAADRLVALEKVLKAA
jgi:hypothetical protein